MEYVPEAVESSAEKYQESLERLNAEYNNFRAKFDAMIKTDHARKALSEKIATGHDSVEKIEAKDKGFRGHDGTRIFYGAFENMEGSLYARFGGDLLRVRSAGGNAVYLNGDANYFYVEAVGTGEHGGDFYALTPQRLGGREILQVTESGVETEHPDHYKYLKLLSDYKAEIERRRAVREDFLAIIKVGFMIEEVPDNTPLIEPVKPNNVIVPLEDLVAVIEKVTEGLEATIATLEEASKK